MISLRQTLRWLSLLSVLLFVTAIAFAGNECTAVYGTGTLRFSLATGSPGELGLVEALAREFNRRNGTSLCWVKAGSGESLKMLKEKKVDLVLVHAPAAEKKAVAEGWAVDRSLIGSNEFYIVGPALDPAGIATAGSAAEAYQKIASSGSKFLSRGDNSGTHKKEMAVWQKAGVTPAGDWYIVTKDFMMATLRKADADKAYFMTDSSTWVAAKRELPNLKILFRGDPMLINTYHGLCQPPGATTAQPSAAKFIGFVTSEEGQNIIRAYGRDLYGDSLYNDATYASQYDH